MGRLLGNVWSALPLRQLAVVVALTVLVLAGLSFGGIAVADYQHQLQKQQLAARVEALKVENQSLQAEIATLQTDSAVEALARDELGWTKSGDTAVIILRPNPPATPVRTPGTPQLRTP